MGSAVVDAGGFYATQIMGIPSVSDDDGKKFPLILEIQ